MSCRSEHPGIRLDPIGASNDDSFLDKNELPCDHAHVPLEKLRNVQEENEVLSSSLFALTTHFAQVQFRLRQVVTSSDGNEHVLKALEEFAFRGIPELGLVKERINENTLSEAVKTKRAKQRKLINELKHQFRGLRQDLVKKDEILAPQQTLFDEMNRHVDFSMFNYREMSKNNIAKIVNNTWNDLETSSKSKDHLINELKNQLDDLEKFIKYLQDNKSSSLSPGDKPKLKQLSVMQRLKTILRMLVAIYISDRKKYFDNFKISNKKTVDWVDLRVKLEEVILKVKLLTLEEELQEEETDYASESEHYTVICNLELLTIIRKELVPAVKDLIEHGSASLYSSIVPFIGCIPWISPKSTQLHAWEIILKYYSLNNGNQYNSKPSRKLSASFNLDITDASSEKGEILGCIGNIIATHTPYKRNYDLHFKAFICAALNSNKLSLWMNVIFRCDGLIKICYFPWSYVAKTRFQDSVRSLDALTRYKFNLQVNLAVKQFEEIEDVFG